VGSFINNFDGVEAADYPDGTFKLVTGGTSLGLGMSGASVLLFKLEPCTILQARGLPVEACGGGVRGHG